MGRTRGYGFGDTRRGRRQHPYDYQQAVGPLAGRVEAPRPMCEQAIARRSKGDCEALRRPVCTPELRQTRTGCGKLTRALPGQRTEDRPGRVSAPRQAIPRQCLGGLCAGGRELCGSRAAASRATVKTRSRDALVTATQCTTAMRKQRSFATAWRTERKFPHSLLELFIKTALFLKGFFAA
jgi:hypothetical protein